MVFSYISAPISTLWVRFSLHTRPSFILDSDSMRPMVRVGAHVGTHGSHSIAALNVLRGRLIGACQVAISTRDWRNEIVRLEAPASIRQVSMYLKQMGPRLESKVKKVATACSIFGLRKQQSTFQRQNKPQDLTTEQWTISSVTNLYMSISLLWASVF